jgi:hypothetical protein
VNVVQDGTLEVASAIEHPMHGVATIYVIGVLNCATKFVARDETFTFDEYKNKFKDPNVQKNRQIDRDSQEWLRLMQVQV